jgi:hypothetical protein
MDTKQAEGRFANTSGSKSDDSCPQRVDAESSLAKKRVVAARRKGASSSKMEKAARPSRESVRVPKAERLVCRYCGSDDLAPSFKKRRDARCRACFKKRYGSAARSKRARRSTKAKAAK